MIIDQAGDDDITVAEEHRSIACTQVHVAREGGLTEHGGETRLGLGAADTDGPGKSIVADGDYRTRAIVGAWPATARTDDAIESQTCEDVGSLHDKGTAAEITSTRHRHTSDRNGTDARAQLGRGSHDESAGLDEDAALQRIGIIGQHQRPITGLRKAIRAREHGGDCRADGRVDGDRRGVDSRGRGQRQRAGINGILSRSDARKDESTDGKIIAQRDRAAGADEIGDVLVRVIPSEIGCRIQGVKPLRIGRGPSAGGTQTCSRSDDVIRGVRIVVPVKVRGPRYGRRRGREQSGGDHQGRSGE